MRNWLPKWKTNGWQTESGEVKNQEWVSPSLNTSADGSLYLSLRDYVRWAMALDHGKLPDSTVLKMAWTPAPLEGSGVYPYGAGWFLLPQRDHGRIGHTGSWQGFQTSIQRYPDYRLTVVALANLAGSRPAPLSEAVAGIVEPGLAAPHMLAAAPASDSSRRVAASVRAIAAGWADTSSLTPSFRRFAAGAWKQELDEALAGATAWETVACEPMSPGRLRYLTSAIARTCYVRGSGPDTRVLASIYYGGDGRIAGIETYSY